MIRCVSCLQSDSDACLGTDQLSTENEGDHSPPTKEEVKPLPVPDIAGAMTHRATGQSQTINGTGIVNDMAWSYTGVNACKSHGWSGDMNISAGPES